MKEILFGWVRNIVYFSILMTVVLHVLPEKGQRKYLQFFMGIILILLAASPLLSAFGLENILDETYARQTYDRELQEFSKRQEKIENAYRERAERSVEEIEKESRQEAQSAKTEGTDGEERAEPEEGDNIGISEIRIEIESSQKGEGP